VKFGDEISLIFSKVLDQVRLGLVEEDEAAQEATDRSYWEKRATKPTIEMMDEMITIIRTFDPTLSLNYRKFGSVEFQVG
jgi:hypothetical protein